MINLLPPEEKEKLLLEIRKRIAIIIWCLFLFFIFCFSLVLLSIKFYLQGQIDYQTITLQETENKMRQAEIKDLQEKFNSFNTALKKLNSFEQKKTYFSEILEKISGILPGGTYLTNISLIPSELADKNPCIQVMLSGFIPTRENLFEFKKILEKDTQIKEIYFPPINWVNPTDINFSITFKIPKD